MSPEEKKVLKYSENLQKNIPIRAPLLVNLRVVGYFITEGSKKTWTFSKLQIIYLLEIIPVATFYNEG